MKIGYVIWGVGWLWLVGGIVALVMGIITIEPAGIAVGVGLTVMSPVWLKWGRDRIQKAVLQRLEEQEGHADQD